MEDRRTGLKPLSLNTIRKAYLDFFESKSHLILPSASLVPKNDPSILLINAGMTPFKKYFTGAETPPAPRIATCQKCIRTIDIENVGKTSRHGTYFEMLGNFSFGDYFKKEAIAWAWELITDVYDMPYDKLSVTVYLDDDEAYDIWHQDIGLPESKIFRLGKEDNFWEHGTGPCGPCSEIFFDRGIEHGCGKASCQPGCDCDRFVEFWNLVFTQFNREEDGTYTPLQHKNIDTGGGLERFAVIMQGVDNLFEVDTVRAILDHACALANVTYGVDPDVDVAIRVIADHMRAAIMMLSDGVLPGNEGRGYVLRRLIRRAMRFGRTLGLDAGFMSTLAPTVIAQSAEHYPDLDSRRDRILMLLSREETKFAETLNQGLGLLDSLIEEARAAGQRELSGSSVFMLHDTYGFPLDLSRDIAEERGMSVDLPGFEAEMAAQKEKARQAMRERVDSAWDERLLPESFERLPATEFTGYDELCSKASILAMLKETEEGMEETDVLSAGDRGIIVLDRTPFYAESGGQVGDRGIVKNEAVARVTDTTKTSGSVWLHAVSIESGTVWTGQSVDAQVDRTRRLATARNHTTTHLLHKALKTVLGDHVEQAGSEVSPGKLRFDFTHFKPISHDERMAIEAEVNAEILRDEPVTTNIMAIRDALAEGAVALFEEKYDDQVRVVSVGDYTKELCGGTHLERSSQAGYFRITGESSIASGVRRIEAVTGEGAIRAATHDKALLYEMASFLKADADTLPERLQKLSEDIKRLRAEMEDMSKEKTRASAEKLVAGAEKVSGIWIVTALIDVSDMAQLREAGDVVRDLLQDSVIVLAAKTGDKLLWSAAASKAAIDRGVHAGSLVKMAAAATGGKGGGKPAFAQAGGLASADALEALLLVKKTIREQLEGTNG
jgi:alanyl-tRNA synthetase